MENGKIMSNGSSKEYGFRVEARETNFSVSRPCVLADGIVGPEWREVRFTKDFNPAGVPADLFGGNKERHDLMEYESALALAYTAVAQTGLGHGLELRIVKYKLECQYTLEKQGVVDIPVITRHWGPISLVKDAPVATVASQQATADSASTNTGAE